MSFPFVDEKRIQRIQNTIQNELGRIIQEEFDIPPKTLISITKVEISPDKQNANIYVSIFPDEKRDHTIDLLKKGAGYLKSFLEKRIRMHPIPKLHFTYDKTIAQTSRVYALMKHRDTKKSNA
ncbi:MAG: ribosome-binding factor A [Candidatus Brennerbacteria bacterium CG11_big_fil_rev_8_21_14_0_20_43_10]|uniref:Ribosome-binding factor A n=3 Tax=Candidatus Brenneribacteriota TaxID=1817902 RepID=A0A2M8C120_9BACT|nr:MAG: ribosome-binding factor A [Candidatus Brennerbacteria bacterium CG23_combo_of_CG06-09_8_20_14_all_44_41]PIR26995.1 MAG: ribosome-binding factor A [Candidatus Brennerbacteria bacterium CG11_big_fil_rev_8_21_14_0_20_43_10]PIX28721.1 MAG: ribosome-binding factor A [Candidatus Brennerbacteria bacterium CG_4_8_14_3_um_filter_43_14]PJB49788.1 MAG: ribosome-binding factor A [Candidatus Brennerbacteria bacterium CG_4_9_14_3_um_filter_43_9]